MFKITVKQRTIILGLTFLLFFSCGQQQSTENTMTKFEEFRRKEKFIPDTNLYYPGIGDQTQKPILTEKINLAANDFEALAKSGNATDKDYQNAIKKGLERFTGFYIDSENQDRVCYCFEELMDIVGLESSDGQLNNFRYGFNPKQDK